VRYGILGDIHANLDALEVVLEHLDHESPDQIICVGDVVGYAACPRECIAIIRERNILTVAGNHDCAAVEKTTIEYFNPDARDAILWTRDQLSPEDKDFLQSLPLTADIDELTLVHSTLHAPELFDYIQTVYDAFLSLQALRNRVCFMGHSHVPITFFDDKPISYFMEPEILLAESEKILVNVGSVGQPRDQDPRAAYAVYDTELKTIWIHRVEYDIDRAAQRIWSANLPRMNGERLAMGR